MARNDPTPEQRDAALTDKTREQFAKIAAALAAGDADTVQTIDEALGDYLQDNQARAELLQRTAAGQNALQLVLADLIVAEASTRAAKEVDEIERHRRDDWVDEQIDRMKWNRAMA